MRALPIRFPSFLLLAVAAAPALAETSRSSSMPAPASR